MKFILYSFLCLLKFGVYRSSNEDFHANLQFPASEIKIN